MRKIYWLLVLLLATMPVIAQSTTVTDDEVNTIAKKLYCPVCENIPLDACGTAACQDWRYEIRLQLESGMTEQQIIDDFIHRFGDRVVGTPQDPLLRALSLVTPWVLIGLVLVGFGWWFIRRDDPTESASGDETPTEKRDTYRQLLEQDLAG